MTWRDTIAVAILFLFIILEGVGDRVIACIMVDSNPLAAWSWTTCASVVIVQKRYGCLTALLASIHQR